MISRMLLILALSPIAGAVDSSIMMLKDQLPEIRNKQGQAIEHYNKAFGLCKNAIAFETMRYDVQATIRSRGRLLQWLWPYLGDITQGFDVFQFEQCIDEYKAALKLVPKFPEAHFNLGYAYFRKIGAMVGMTDNNNKNDVDELFKHFRLYVKYSPKTTHSELVRKWLKQLGKAS